MDLSRIRSKTLFVSAYEHIPIRKSHSSCSFYFLTFSTEPGEYPDMEKLLSVYLRDKNLEQLPYVTGYAGEFCEGIMQEAGPRRVPGTLPVLYILLPTSF